MNNIDFRDEERYIAQIRAIPKLIKKEEVFFVRQIKSTNPVEREAAISIIWKANMYLVIDIAFKFKSRFQTHASSGDLISEGIICLREGVRRLDYQKENFDLIHYLRKTIRNNLSGVIRAQERLVSIKAMEDKVKDFFQASQKLLYKNKRPPSRQEISDFLKISVKKVEEIILHLKERAFSFDEHNDDALSLHELIPAPISSSQEDVSHHNSVRRIINKELNSFSPKTKGHIIDYFGLNYEGEQNYQEIADKIRQTRANIHSSVTKAIEKMKHNPRLKDLFEKMKNK